MGFTVLDLQFYVQCFADRCLPICHLFLWPLKPYRCNGVMVSLFSSVVVDLRSGQTKDYKIGICCFSAKHTAPKRKRKDCLARNHDNVSEWGNMSIRGLLFQRLVVSLSLVTERLKIEQHHSYLKPEIKSSTPHS